ncbi:c-type cytochrome [Undibacterium arcticum]|uniref:C-type cytochrome n=1 Tax=Undibacterium arcticum TaxID=1762892 RepID=A0ABV7F8E9_9BURK
MKNLALLRRLVPATLIAGLLVSAGAQAQFRKVDDAVEYRKAALHLMGAHFGRIGAVVKGDKPYDKAAVEADVAVIEMMSKLPWPAFIPNSAGGHSKAKPEIWSQQAEFKTATEKMEGEVAKLSAAAKSGDLAAIKVSFGSTGQSCKSCHDNFRNR